MAQAHQHLESAGDLQSKDPEGAYAVLYDAARKALYDAALAQLEPPLGEKLRPFDRMRRRRREA